MTSNLPKLLIVTDDCISPSHGTGSALLRQLADFPEEILLHAFLNLKGDPFLSQSFQIDPRKEKPLPLLHRILPRPLRSQPQTLSTREFVQRALRQSRQIDIVYSCVFGEKGLRLVSDILDLLPPGTPTIHHAMDFLYQKKSRFERILRDLSPRISEFWAIGPGILDEIKRITGRIPILMTPFQCELRPQLKTSYSDFGPSSTVVMLGNSHMPWVLHHLRKVWSEIRQAFPDLKPIQWYAYPSSVGYVKQAGVIFEPDIEYYGFLNDRVLHEHLCNAEFAIVPFNIQDKPEYHYAQYSIPSRITELIHAGLPLFAAAGKNTEAFRFITRNHLGICATLADEETFTDRLLEFARDRSLREQIGTQNRQYAEQRCDIRTYRKELITKLKALADPQSSPSLARSSFL